MIEILDKSKCCACTACMSICSKKCIEMKPDHEGFLYPVVDMNTCINCGLCEKVCPIINKINVEESIPVTYAVQNKNVNILGNSTSGGFFIALCEYVIENRGYAVGVAFDEGFQVIHKIVSTIEEARAFMGSKYVQSDLSNVFGRVKNLLNKGKLVCFSGTPCQIGGLKSFLGQDYRNLITVDLVCRSIPSPKLWMKYLKYQKNRYNSEIESIRFRSKTYGYHSGSIIIRFSNGKVYSGSNRVDLYAKSFHHDVCSRPSCYDCKFKTLSRCSDYTIFDCWYPEMMIDNFKDNDKGYTNVIIHSQKGKEIFGKINCAFNSYTINTKEAASFTGNMIKCSVQKPKERRDYYNTIDTEPFNELAKKYVTVTQKDKLIEYSKSIFYKSGILNWIKKFKKLM